MQVVAQLVVEPSIEWTRQDGTVVNASSGYSLQLNFNPLRISDSSCRATVTITGVGSVCGEASRDLPLTSEMIDLEKESDNSAVNTHNLFVSYGPHCYANS